MCKLKFYWFKTWMPTNDKNRKESARIEIISKSEIQSWKNFLKFKQFTFLRLEADSNLQYLYRMYCAGAMWVSQNHMAWQKNAIEIHLSKNMPKKRSSQASNLKQSGRKTAIESYEFSDVDANWIPLPIFRLSIYSLRHRKSGVRVYMHELFVSKTRTSEVRASEGFWQKRVHITPYKALSMTWAVYYT